MTVAVQSTNRAPRPSGLADVLELVLDRGVVIDAYVRVALVGIEILTLDARIVIASVDTYLRFAEAVNRLDLQAQDQQSTLPELLEDLRGGGAASKTKGALRGAKDSVTEGAKEVASSVRERVGSESGRRRAPAERSAPRDRRGSRRPRDEDED